MKRVNKEPLLTLKEASVYIGVHPDTLRRWEKDGFIRAVRTLGGHRRYTLYSVEAAIRGMYHRRSNI